MKKMLTACVVFTLGLSMAAGQNAASYVGVWSVRIDTQTFAVVALTMSEGGLVGNVTLPEQFETNGLTISHISGSAHENLVEKAVVEGSSLHLTTHSLSDPTDKDEWLMALPVGNTSSLRPAAMPMAPWPMQSDAGAKVSLIWDKSRTYSLLESSVPSPEMAKIFEEDQRVRVGVTWTAEYASRMGPGDHQRREQVRDLLGKGKLRSGLDFERAAFIFQHGENSQDFLLAHALALAALVRGEKSASWIASVSLDRYLLTIGQPQILGTQMNFGVDTGLRKPYDSALVPEALRRQLGLQTPEDEAEQIKLLAQPGFIPNQ
jgi:hypothetical protein